MANREEDKQDKYNVERVHKIGILLTVIVVLLFGIQAALTQGLMRGLDVGLQGVIVLVFVLIIYFLPLKRYTKGLLLTLIPAIVVGALFYLDKYALNKHYIIISTIAMAAFYFKKELILIHGGVVNVLFFLV